MENSNQNKALTEQQSLDIITSAINDTRSRMVANTGAQMLLWGYTITITSLTVAAATQYALIPTVPALWFAIPVIGFIGRGILHRRHPRTEYPSNRILAALWWTIGAIAGLIFIFSAHFFTVSLLLAAATIVTGIITREKVVTVAGAAALLTAAVIPIYKFLHPTAALFGTETVTPTTRVASYELWFALIAAVMFIIPGHILRCRKRANMLTDK